MEVIGIKGNRKTSQIGSKKQASTHGIGIKLFPKTDVNTRKGNDNINDYDSKILETQLMNTGLDKANNIKPNKNGLERSNKK
jgi:hypothetical protein